MSAPTMPPAGPPPGGPNLPQGPPGPLGLPLELLAQMLYQPLPGSTQTMGSRLQEMQRDGRRLVNQQRGRWQRSREAYRGNFYIAGPAMVPGGTDPPSGQRLYRMAPGDLLESGRRRDSVNRLAQMVDGRVALLSAKQPPSDVEPPDYSQDAIDGARMAKRLVDFEWANPSGWDVASFTRELALEGEQDGIVLANVLYDRSRGPACPEAVAPDPATGVPRPVTDRGELEALLAQDPAGGRLWQRQLYPAGDVVFRTVRAGTCSFDPAWQRDWAECGWIIESRKRPIHEVERQVGMPIRDLIKRSDAQLGKTKPTPRATNVQLEGEGGTERRLDPRYEVLVHEAFVRSTGDTGEWPLGAHVIWVEEAPATPLMAEPWLWPNGDPRGLPYRPYRPRPDGGHPLLCQGTVDVLLPIQLQLNRRLSQYGEWLDLVARPMLILSGGQLRSRSVFNSARLIEVAPGADSPRFMQVPADPGTALIGVIQFLERQMSEIALSNSSRGQTPGGGVEAAAAINALIAQDEQMMAGTEAEFRGIVEWAVSEGLLNVQHFYTIPRLVQTPGVDDEAEFQAFVGRKLRGATRYRVTGSVMPKSAAMKQQMLLQFMQYAGPRFDPTPFAPEIIEGEVDVIISIERTQTRKQDRENREMAAVGARPDADDLWQNFVWMRDAYLQAAQLAQQEAAAIAAGPAGEMGPSPQQLLAQVGAPPRIIDMLRRAGERVPTVELTDRDHMHIRSLEIYMTGDGFDRMHPAAQQVFREHLDEHLGKQARNVSAMAAQTPQFAEATPGAQPMEAPAPAEGQGQGQQAAA